MSVVMGNDNNEITKKINLGPEAIINESDRPDYRKEFRPVHLAPKGSKFIFFNKLTNRLIYPETYHSFNPMYLKENTIRKYEEHYLTYVYHIYGDKPFCRIYSPDGTKIEIYDPRTVMKYIEHHKNEVTIGRKHVPRYDYVKLYKQKFEVFRKEEDVLAEQKLKDTLKK